MLPSLLRIKRRRETTSGVSPSLSARDKPSPSMYSRPDLNALEQFIDFLIAQLLTQAAENVPQLPDTNVSVPFLVKHLKSANEFLGCAGRLEAVGPVKDVEEGIEVDCGEGREMSLFKLVVDSAVVVTHWNFGCANLFASTTFLHRTTLRISGTSVATAYPPRKCTCFPRSMPCVARFMPL